MIKNKSTMVAVISIIYACIALFAVNAIGAFSVVQLLEYNYQPAESLGATGTFSHKLNLPSDEYSLTIQYSNTSGEEIEFHLIDVSSYNEQTNYMNIPYAAALPPGEGTLSATINLENGLTYGHLVLLEPAQTPQQEAELLISNVTLRSTKSYVTKEFVRFLFIMASIIGFYAASLVVIKKEKETGKISKKLFVCLVLFSLTFISNYLFLSNIYVTGHDVFFHTARVGGLAQSFELGQFPSHVNSYANFGYGYKNAVFYPELFLIPFSLLGVLGLDSLAIITLMSIAINTVAPIIAYYSFSTISQKNEMVGLAATVVYILSVYRLQNIYLRGAIGESLFMLFLPLAVLGLYNVMYQKGSRWYILVIAISCIVQAHVLGTLLTIITLLICFICFAVDLVLVKKQGILKQLKQLVVLAIASVCINIGFIIPFIINYRYDYYMFDAQFNYQRFMDMLLSFNKLLSFDISLTVADGIVWGIGFSIIFAIGISLVGCVGLIKKKAKDRVAALLIIIPIALMVLFINPISWELLGEVSVLRSFATTVQFPFRIYSIIILLTSLLMALIFRNYSKKVNVLLFAAVFAASLFTSAEYLTNIEPRLSNDDNYYHSVFSDMPQEYLLIGHQDIALEMAKEQKVEFSQGVIINSYHKEGSRITLNFENTSSEDGFVLLPVYYYHDYVASSENVAYQTFMATNGKLGVVVPPNTADNITVEPVIRKVFVAGYMVSAVSVLVVAYEIFSKGRLSKALKRRLKPTKNR